MSNITRAAALALLIAIMPRSAIAQTEPTQQPDSAAGRDDASKLPSGQQRMSVSFAGKVHTKDGSEIGEVEDLTVEGNRIAGAIIELEDRLGIGGRSIAVPIEMLRRDGDRLVIEATRDQLLAWPTLRE